MRPSMEQIVLFLRQYGQASDNEEFAGITYWTDDQLEAIADQHSYRERVSLKTIQDTSPTIYRVNLPPFHFMENDFAIYDENGASVASPVGVYSQARQEIEFASALSSDLDYEVEALFVLMYDALADLWTQKASQRFDYVDFKAGNNKMDMSQERKFCESRAAYYRGKTLRRWPKQRGRWAV